MQAVAVMVSAGTTVLTWLAIKKTNRIAAKAIQDVM